MLSYITVLSNWLKGYDRYQSLYSKAHIAQSTYPHEFYLLKDEELHIGLEKAESLAERTGVEGERIIRILSGVKDNQVTPNLRNGKGWVYGDHKIPVKGVELYVDGGWERVTVEDITALAFKLQGQDFKSYQELRPLTFSFLPIAMACQASCLFCFSGSSISSERKKRIKDFTHLSQWCEKAQEAGAERFVLTGGGEPTILPFPEIIECLETASQYFKKNVLITNGIFLSKCEEDEIETRLKALKKAGLSILSFSYHHKDPEGLKKIMGVDTNIEKVLKVWSRIPKDEVPTVRLICVLQQGGVGDEKSINEYLDFAASYGVTQVCFKELYVSSTTESIYSGGRENLYSKNHQVSLSVLIDMMKKNNAEQVGELAWGSPIYAVERDGHTISVAAYTEPSVGWERVNGIARSWNYMADEKCFASLEDEDSEILLEEGV